MSRRLNRTAAVIPMRGNYFLTSRRINTEAYRGYHQFPGGREDHPHESSVEIAQRELKEETGLDLPLERFVHLGNNPHDMDCNSCDMFFVELLEGEEPAHLEPEKHTPWTWMPIDELRKLTFIEGVIDFVEALAGN